MAYKKYVYREGKRFGPYYCHSYKDDEKVRTRFVSGPKKTYKIKKEDFKKKKGNY